jgi:hypothetical protein
LLLKFATGQKHWRETCQLHFLIQLLAEIVNITIYSFICVSFRQCWTQFRKEWLMNFNL